MSAALRGSTLLRHGLFFLGLALVLLLLTSFVFDAYTNYNVTEVAIYAICAAGLTVLGIENQLLPDGLWLRGAEGFGGGSIDSLGDHRIAMAFAIAALRARGPIEILDVANVATSFPGFPGTARAAGLQIEAA